MAPTSIRPHVARLFRGSDVRRTRVGVEHELVVADRRTGDAVPLPRLRAATAGAAYAAHLAFEPGGQVELSLPPAAGPQQAGAALDRTVAALRRDAGRAGLDLLAVPVDPRPVGSVPRRLGGPRYDAMERHFDTIGPAGRRMMRLTASTQLCLDWWSGRAGAEQWRVLHLAGPFLAARFARGRGPSSRLATWLAVDPSRTSFDDRLVRGADPVAAYADFAAAAAVFAAGGTDDHLSTLFPAVRPRGHYLEVRFLDVQPAGAVGPIAALLARLLYDDDCRAAALALLEPERRRLDEHWVEAAHGTGTHDLGDALARLAGAARTGAA